MLALPAGTSKNRHRIIHADVLDFVRDYRGPLMHALLSDPPYHLTTITKRFGSETAAPAKFGKDGAFARASRGFMNQTWDGGDLAFNSELWRAFGELLLPGAFGMAFASTRGYHRLATAIEDAGFILHPMVVWVTGQGFPKATRVKDTRFDGYRYGMQALKPSCEPICIFQKPYRGRPQGNIIDTGAGTLHIDAARIAGEPWSRSTTWTANIRGGNLVNSQGTVEIGPREMDEAGRWPANLVLQHDPDCTANHCVPGCPVLVLSEQSGVRPAGGDIVNPQSVPALNVYSGRFSKARPFTGYEDSGTASRFFFNGDWSFETEERINEAYPFFYAPKVGADERNRGLENFAAQTVNDGRQKPIDNPYQRGETVRLNSHPTLKPIKLTTWLASLLLPPPSYGPRRLFVPFAGAASEIIGASLAGWETIYGVEASHEYIQIARARINYYDDPLRAMRMAAPETSQPALFEVANK